MASPIEPPPTGMVWVRCQKCSDAKPVLVPLFPLISEGTDKILCPAHKAEASNHYSKDIRKQQTEREGAD